MNPPLMPLQNERRFPAFHVQQTQGPRRPVIAKRRLSSESCNPLASSSTCVSLTVRSAPTSHTRSWIRPLSPRSVHATRLPSGENVRCHELHLGLSDQSSRDSSNPQTLTTNLRGGVFCQELVLLSVVSSRRRVRSSCPEWTLSVPSSSNTRSASSVSRMTSRPAEYSRWHREFGPEIANRRAGRAATEECLGHRPPRPNLPRA